MFDSGGQAQSANPEARSTATSAAIKMQAEYAQIRPAQTRAEYAQMTIPHCPACTRATLTTKNCLELVRPQAEYAHPELIRLKDELIRSQLSLSGSICKAEYAQIWKHAVSLFGRTFLVTCFVSKSVQIISIFCAGPNTLRSARRIRSVRKPWVRSVQAEYAQVG